MPSSQDVSLPSDDALYQEASDWFLRIHDADQKLPPQQHHQFQQWIMINPAHERAYHQVVSASQLLNSIDTEQDTINLPSVEDAFAALAKETTIHTKAANDSVFKRYAIAASVLLCITLPFLLKALWPQLPTEPDVYSERFQTAVAQIRTIELPDGSHITLSPASDITASVSADGRQVHLRRGEAYFDIAKNSAKPFKVMIGHTQIQVLGTEFNVHRHRDQVSIAVAEGKVAVKSELNQTAELVQGQAIVSHIDNGLSAIKPMEANNTALWRQGQLRFDNAPLQRVIDDLNRYYQKNGQPSTIVLGSADLGELTVTAAVNTDDIEAAMSIIAASLSLNIEPTHYGLLLSSQEK